MKKQLSAAELLESYLYEVGKRLSSTGKEDILKELQSNIEEQLENKEDVERLKDVLTELGAPEVIAQHYSGKERYLIGPELYETYWMVMLIVGLIGFMGTTLGDFLSGKWAPAAENLARQVIWHMGSNVLSVGIGTVGTVTLIFMVIEFFLHLQSGHYSKRNNKDQSLSDLKAKQVWSPEKLTLVPTHRDHIKLNDAIWDIVWVVIGFSILNFGLDRVTAYYFETSEGTYQSLPLINNDFVGSYLLWINLLFAGAFLLCLYQFKTRKWNLITRLIDSVISLLMIGFVIGLLTSPNLMIPGIYEQLSTSIGVGVQSIEKGVMTGIQGFLSVFVIVEMFTIGKHGFTLFSKK